MASPHRELISEHQFFHVAYPIIILASVFVLARIGIHIWRKRAMELQDYFLYAVFIFFLTMSISYLIIVPTIYAIGKVKMGAIEPWPTLKADVVTYIRMMFVTMGTFWLSLWSVKLSLLCLYKKLMEGLPVVYIRLWWGVFIFCIIGLIGSFISYFTSCPDFVETMNTGNCAGGARSVRGQLASLYASYAVDIVSDFMIMFLPIRLVWNLQMARSQKVATIALFASGFICVGFATLRVVQIGSTSGGNTSPSPTWLALWTIIEAGVALCIGCGPAFAVFYRRTQTLNVSYDTHGYFRHPQSCSGVDPSCPNAIKMSSVTISTGRKRASRRDTYWEDTRSSQEELAAEGKGITVTTTLEQNHRRSKTTER